MSAADGEPGVIKLGYTIAPALQGRGYGTEAVGALVSYAFRTLGAEVVRMYASADNIASIRVAEKVGLRLVESIPGRESTGEQAADVFLGGAPCGALPCRLRDDGAISFRTAEAGQSAPSKPAARGPPRAMSHLAATGLRRSRRPRSMRARHQAVPGIPRRLLRLGVVRAAVSPDDPD